MTRNFADFIINGSPEEKEKVYRKVMDDSIKEQYCKVHGHVWAWKPAELGYSVTRTCANCRRMERSCSIYGWRVISEAEQKVTGSN